MSLVLLIPDIAAQSGARPAAVAEAVVDGFIVYSLRDRDPLLPAVLSREVPTVVIDAPRVVVGADWVGSDDRAAMRGLGDYLRDLGHRAVGIIGPQLDEMRHNGPAGRPRWRYSGYALMRERIEGLLEGLGAQATDAGAAVQAGVEVPIEERFEHTPSSGADALHALLDRSPNLAAVCCLTDVLALGAMDGARQRGLTVPGDLTITGYDDVPSAALAGLTTIAQAHVEKGRAAGDLILTAAGSTEDRRRLLRTHLQIRASSGPPR